MIYGTVCILSVKPNGLPPILGFRLFYHIINSIESYISLQSLPADQQEMSMAVKAHITPLTFEQG